MYQILDERHDFSVKSAFLFDKSVKVFGGNKKSSYICRRKHIQEYIS